jgi:hypothetical protein
MWTNSSDFDCRPDITAVSMMHYHAADERCFKGIRHDPLAVLPNGSGAQLQAPVLRLSVDRRPPRVNYQLGGRRAGAPSGRWTPYRVGSIGLPSRTEDSIFLIASATHSRP